MRFTRFPPGEQPRPPSARRVVAVKGRETRAGILRYWQTCSLPGHPVYLLGMLHDHRARKRCFWHALAELLRLKLTCEGRLPNPSETAHQRLPFPATCRGLSIPMNHDSADQKQKRERFQQLAQNPKVKIGKVFAADVRKSRIHPTVKKLTAWRKANRLSQPEVVAVLGQYYFHITFASLRSWEEGRRSPNPHTAGILEKFLSDHPTVERPKK
jgi:DNA-binding transcriptional regulator YiaG